MYFFNFINDLIFKINQNKTNNQNFCKIEGDEYYLPNIRRMQGSFYEIYEKNKEVFEENEKYSKLDPLDQVLNFDLRPSEVYEIEMDFQYWKYLFEITDYFKEQKNDEDQYEDNNWFPPDNFRDGTDDEQETWKLHNKN
jgi:hypothetical protein